MKFPAPLPTCPERWQVSVLRAVGGFEGFAEYVIIIPRPALYPRIGEYIIVSCYVTYHNTSSLTYRDMSAEGKRI